MVRIAKISLSVALGSLGLMGCSFFDSYSGSDVRTQTVIKEVVVEKQAPLPPGVVEYVWEEPMVDVIDVPPGLDPEGHYYRPGHREIVEIRQGRWKHYKPLEK